MNVAVPPQRDLVAAARLGDRVAFADLITVEYPIAFKLAFALLRDPNEAEDAVQEAAFKAWRNIDQLRADAPFRPWLLGIVANQCRTAIRGRWWSVIRSSDVRPSAGTMSADDLASLELRTALMRLPYDQRLVLILRYYVDLSYEDIAAQLQISSMRASSKAIRWAPQ